MRFSKETNFVFSFFLLLVFFPPKFVSYMYEILGMFSAMNVDYVKNRNILLL